MNDWKSAKVGDVIEWGSYPTEADGTVLPLRWIVIGCSPQGLLVLAERGLDMRRYHQKEQDITWEKGEIRRWLNGEFLHQAFNEAEIAQLLETDVYNDDNEEFETPAGADTRDKVFLLSIDEFDEFCADEDWCVCCPTPYALKQGVQLEEDAGDDACCWWWLRSPGAEEDFALTVGECGEVGAEGTPVEWPGGAVRPAVQLRLN